MSGLPATTANERESRQSMREFGALLRLSWPIAVTQVTQMSMGVMDTVMASRLGPVEVSGVQLGGALFWPVLLLLSGVAMALTPSVSQLRGSGRTDQIAEVARQTLWIMLGMGLLLVAFIRNVEPLYLYFGVDPAAAEVAVAYLSALSFGVVQFMMYFSLRYLCDGMSWTKPAMIIALIAVSLKLPLNVLFIYGAFGLPGLGGVGCGYSSALVMTAQLISMALVVTKGRIAHLGVFYGFSRPRFGEMLRIFKLGLPIGAGISLEMAVFSVTTILVAKLGVLPLNAHAIAASISSIAFMLPLALGMGATIRVGFFAGAHEFEQARRAVRVALMSAFVVAVVLLTVLAVFRYPIASLYTPVPEVVSLGASLLLLVALYQLVDDVQIVAVGALRGFKDTRTPMFVSIIAYWLIGLPLGIFMAFGYEGAPLAMLGFDWTLNVPANGVQGLWWGLVVGLVVAAAALLARVRYLMNSPQKIIEMSKR